MRCIRIHRTVVSVLALTCLGTACSPSSLVDVQSSSTVVDPATVQTQAGAQQLYTYAVLNFSQALGGNALGMQGSVAGATGLFTDELAETPNGSSGAIGLNSRNASVFGAPGFGIYGSLYRAVHWPRTEAQQARQALQLYAPSLPSALQGHLLAIEGYAVLWFAEIFCSGIPLPAIPLVGSRVATGGVSTEDMYARAIALFDSAIAIGADSARFVNLAHIGKGRALLGLGRQADAAAAVQAVPTDFVYQTSFSATSNPYQNGFALITAALAPPYRAIDGEGTNGLVWSTDPRTAVFTRPTLSGAMLRPLKYYLTAGGAYDPSVAEPGAPMRMADGLEARLIEAEAALAAGDGSWLTTLNTLRATCVGTAVCAPVPGLTAGLLPPLIDPGSAVTRLSLLMTERAMWLYMTGHRQGDLRRLAHVYHRDPNTLWPVGIMSSPAFPPAYTSPTQADGLPYGLDLVFQPDAAEQTNNPAYGGCFDVTP